MRVKASQSAMDYFRRNISKAHVEIGGFGGVRIAVDPILPPDWMVVSTKRGELRYFKLTDAGLVEMVPPADFGQQSVT